MGLDDFAFGIDISQYQCYPDDSKLIDFNCLKQHEPKISFIIARATVSWGYKDTRFDWYWQEMQRIGVCRAAYHFAYPSQDYKRQANWFLATVNPQEHDRLAIDLEVVQGVGKIAMTDFANALISYIQECTGKRPILYSRKQWLEDYLYPDRLVPVDLWLAQYANVQGAYAPEKTPPPDLPKGFSTWLIHQTGGYCKPFCNAASKVLDYDRWNGTEEDVRTYFGYTEQPEPPTPPEPPDPDEPLFVGVVTAEPYLNIREYPTTQSKDLGDLFPGMHVNVYEIVPNWYRIDDGWVASAWVKRDWGGGLIETPLFSQKDPLWRYKKLGTSASTIGGYGCLLTSAAMVCAHYGKATNPDLLNQAMIRVNGYASGNLWKFWSLSAVYPDITIRDYVDCETTPAPLALVDTRLAEGIPVIVKVDYYPGGAVQQHWILLCGKQGDDYIAADPISGTRILFRQKYGDPARYIFRVVCYEHRVR